MRARVIACLKWPALHLGSYRNIMLFQISSSRENRYRDTRVIKMRVLRKVFSKQFCFIRCRRQHLWAVEYRRYSRFTFVENTISNLPKVLRAKFLGSDRLLCFSSICKFGSFKNSFATITSLSILIKWLEDFMLVKKKAKRK